MIALKNKEDAVGSAESSTVADPDFTKKRRTYHQRLCRVCSRSQPSPNSNGVHVVTGPPTARGSLILNEQNTANSDEKKLEERFFYRSSRPGVLVIISKLFPCFPCCQKRNAQIV